jgi:hypothetical protein
MNLAVEHKVDAVLQAGDFFDSPDPSKELMAGIIRLLREYPGLPIYAVHGQHDMVYHSVDSIRRSALQVLAAAGVVVLLGDTGIPIPKTSLTTLLYGASFGQKPPTVAEGPPYKVLVVHAMVGTTPLWPGQELTGPEAYAKEHPGYNLYVFGDYHYRFRTRVGKTTGWAVNAGCLLRLTTTDRILQPAVIEIDTSNPLPQELAIACVPACFAFVGEDAIKATDEDVRLKALVEQLRAGGTLGTSFRENLEAFYRTHSTPTPVRVLIGAALEQRSES